MVGVGWVDRIPVHGEGFRCSVPARIQACHHRLVRRELFSLLFMEAEQVSGELLFKIWPWLEANRKGLIVAAVGVCVLVGAVSYVSSARQQREVTAGSDLTHLLSLAPAGPDTLLQFADTHSGTQAGVRARLAAGVAYYQQKNYPQAQQLLESFAQQNVGTALGNQATYAVGACLEAQGKLDLAASAFARVANSPVSDGSQPLAYFALGRIAEAQGRWKEAEENFQKVRRAVSPQLPLSNDAVRHLMTVEQKLAQMPAAASSAPAASFVPTATGK